MSQFVTPEGFLDELGMNEIEVKQCAQLGIFTIRQLAEAELYIFEFFEPGRFQNLIEAARSVVASSFSERKEKEKYDRSVWGYIYISAAMHEQLSNDTALKSPYVLFQEYLDCKPEQRDTHPWKSIYYSYLEAASEWLEGAKSAISDADVFSYLIWKGAHLTLGKFDLTAWPRAIHFLYTWLPGELHGSALEIDKVIATELNNPYIGERYAYPIAVNLTKLFEKYDAKLFKVQNEGQRRKLDTRNWKPLELYEVENHAKDALILYEQFNPGEELFETVPHGCVVTPTGSVPADCIKIFERKQVVERIVRL